MNTGSSKLRDMPPCNTWAVTKLQLKERAQVQQQKALYAKLGCYTAHLVICFRHAQVQCMLQHKHRSYKNEPTIQAKGEKYVWTFVTSISGSY